MSVKDIREAMSKGFVYFGLKQAIKNFKIISNVFVSRDARPETLDKLKASGVDFIVLKPKAEVSRELNLDFESEVFSIRNTSKA